MDLFKLLKKYFSNLTCHLKPLNMCQNQLNLASLGCKPLYNIKINPIAAKMCHLQTQKQNLHMVMESSVFVKSNSTFTFKNSGRY